MNHTFRDSFRSLVLPDDFVIDSERPMSTALDAETASVTPAATARRARTRSHASARFGVPPGVRGRIGRRLGSAVLPAALGIALAMFALVRMQSANTLWSQEVQLSGSVGTGTFGCQPYTVALKGTPTVANGKTTYTYTFSGGGISGPECAKNMSYIALPVCFNPQLVDKGIVLSETHPANWTYAPDNGGDEKRVKWNAGDSVGHGPFNAIEFSFTLPGTGIQMESGTFQVHAGGGKDPTITGTAQVPHPDSCNPKARTLAPVAPLTNNAITTDTAPATDGGAKVASTQPTATPSPTSTPTATPTPKTVNKPGEYKGILKFPSTPTPAAGE